VYKNSQRKKELSLLNEMKAAIKERLMLILFIGLIVFALLPNSYMTETPLQFSITIIMSISYIFLFWIPNENWKPIQLETITVVIGTVSLVKSLVVGGEGYGMMLPLAIYIGHYIGGNRSILYASFFCICTSLLLMFDENLAFVHVVSFILTYIGCYLGSRGYRIQNEAYESNQLHLEELQKAHLELQEAHEQLQDAAIDTMQVAVLEERTRIARDIHDALGHSLTSLIVQLHALKYMLHEGPPQAQDAVQNMLGVAKQSLEEIRSSVHTLASDSTWLGLTPLRSLISQAEKHTGLKMELQADELDIPLSREIAISLYRVLQEAITNTLRHSDASHLKIIVKEQSGSIHLSIQDDGSITRKNKIKPGFGLMGMQERIDTLNGTLTYFIREPHGFQMNVSIPIENHENLKYGKERIMDG
jgi:signal transduction histidine kinase